MSKLLGVLSLILLSAWVLSGLAVAPAPAAVVLTPDRPTPLPLPTVTPPIAGGFIELHAAPAGAWTIVQWRGVGATWHNTDGWRGAPDETGVVRWYVGPEHLGQGPFRWRVYEREGGRLLATSDAFALPARARQVVVVTLEPAGTGE